MKKIERIALWMVSLMLIVSGVISVVWQTFGTGKSGFGIPPIEGPIAAVFGAAFVAIGLYFAYLLSRSATTRKREAPEEPIQPPETTRGK